MTLKENIEELIKEANELREYTGKLEKLISQLTERLEEVLKR